MAGSSPQRDEFAKAVALHRSGQLAAAEAACHEVLRADAKLGTLPDGMKVETLGEDFDAGPDAFADTAVVMQHCDLIITCDTSIAHLAGALGCPTWIALKYVAEWRWGIDRSDSPWYPSARLFRQVENGNWDSVFRDMAFELKEHPGA
jgi:hypothetical protein